jgi:hypothetical protein
MKQKHVIAVIAAVVLPCMLPLAQQTTHREPR